MDKLHNLQPQAINYGSAASGSVTTPENPRNGADRAKTGTVAGGGDVVKLTDAAAALDLKLGTLRRMIREGLPVVRRANAKGGRGCGTLLHVPTARAWLAARQQPAEPVEALLMTLASELPAVVAAALDVAGRRIESPRKPELLRLMPALWFLVSTALRDNLTDKFGCPELATLTETDMPTSMARLLDSKLQSKR